MCIIIDANIASLVFAESVPDDFQPITHWINNGDGKMAFGGKNGVELRKVGRAGRQIREWARQGKAYQINNQTVDQETNRLENGNSCVSDDPHIIALASISRARLLCSHDRDLHADFTNPHRLKSPRGKVYQNAGHDELLKHTTGCPYRRSSK